MTGVRFPAIAGHFASFFLIFFLAVFLESTILGGGEGGSVPFFLFCFYYFAKIFFDKYFN